jgi:hypothetical protein
MKTLTACVLFAAQLAFFACQPTTRHPEQESTPLTASTQTPNSTPVDDPVSQNAWKFCTNGTRIRMRAAPNLDAKILTTIPLAGEKLTWTGKQVNAPNKIMYNGDEREGSWMEFKYQEYTGWIFDAGVTTYQTQGEYIYNPLYICGLGSVRGVNRADLERVFGKPIAIDSSAPSEEAERWELYLIFKNAGPFFGVGYAEEGYKSSKGIEWFESSIINLSELPQVFIRHPEITLRAGTTYAEVEKVFGPSVNNAAHKRYNLVISNGDCGDFCTLDFKNNKLVAVTYVRDCCSL